ncbi:hypothetical protein DER45DRAFT_37765 [Fusarium avenaceum]|nr:hypothetical protein DER45DRAFT_37765 [Fusarium avenaceum]
MIRTRMQPPRRALVVIIRCEIFLLGLQLDECDGERFNRPVSSSELLYINERMLRDAERNNLSRGSRKKAPMNLDGHRLDL